MDKEEIRRTVEKCAPHLTIESIERISEAIFSKLEESKTAKKE